MATANIPWDDGSGQNMSVEWDGTENGEIVISSPTNPSLSSSRNKTIQVRTTAGSPQITRTINVVQEAAVYIYEYEIQPSSSAVIAASGGTISYTATLKIYLQGSLLKTESVTPTCRIISGTGFSALSNAVTAANRGTEYSTSQRSAQVAVEFVTAETGETLSETVTVTQAANNRVVVYGKPTITSFEVADIPASGGSVSSGDVEYSQSRHYYYDSGDTEELSALTTGGQVTFGDPVTAESLTTNLKDRTIVGQLTCQVTMNGQTSVEGDASVYQQENTFISWVILYGPDIFPRSGTTDIYFERLAWNWTSGYYTIQDGRDLDYFQISTQIESDLIDDVYDGHNGNNGEFYFNDVGVVPNKTSSSKSGTLYLHITAADTSIFDHTEEFDVTQSAGVKTYGVPVITNFSYPIVPASGGNVSPNPVTYSQTWGWNGATTGGGTITSGATIQYELNGDPNPGWSLVDTSTGVVNGPSKGTTLSDVTQEMSVRVIVTLNGKSNDSYQVVEQAANSATYGNVTITGGSVSTIPASGGSISSASGISASQTISFTSGSTKSGKVSISYSAAVSAKSKGTTISGQTTAGTLTATATGEGSKSATKQFTVYQAANAQTQTGIRIVGDATGGDGWIPYANWDSIKANGKASDSTTTTNDNGWAIRFAGYKQYSYTSGATNEVGVSFIPSNACYTDADYIEKHDFSGFKFPSRGTTVGAARTGHVWWEEGGFVSNKLAFTQEANSSSDSYNNPVISRPSASHNFGNNGGTWASGVSVSQIGTRTYTSGSTTSISGSASFTLSESASWLTTSGGSITASSNTGSSRRSATVTISATGSGGKTASSSISITQDAGAYLNVSPISLSFTAAGGTKSITIDTNESWTIE